MARRTKSQRRKEIKSGIKFVPGKMTNPYVVWSRRPCIKEKKFESPLIQHIMHEYSCKYVELNPLAVPEDCPMYDSRYCPSSNQEDED